MSPPPPPPYPAPPFNPYEPQNRKGQLAKSRIEKDVNPASAIELASKLAAPQPGESPVMLSPDLPTETLFAAVLHARNHYAALGFIGNRILSAFSTKSDVFPTFEEDHPVASDTGPKGPSVPKVSPLNPKESSSQHGSSPDSQAAGQRPQQGQSEQPSAKSESERTREETKQSSSGGSSRALLNLPKVSSKEIERRFKQLAVRIHPDKVNHPLAERAFQRLTEAFAVLRDEEKRLKYDASLDDFSVLFPFYRRGSLPITPDHQQLLENPKGDELIRRAAYGDALATNSPVTYPERQVSLPTSTPQAPESSLSSAPSPPRAEVSEDNSEDFAEGYSHGAAAWEDFSEIQGLSPTSRANGKNSSDPVTSELEAAYLDLCAEAEAALPRLAPDPVEEARLAKFALAARARELARKKASLALQQAQEEAKDFLRKQREAQNEMFMRAKSIVEGALPTQGRRGSVKTTTATKGAIGRASSKLRPLLDITRAPISASSNVPTQHQRKTPNGVSFDKLAKAYGHKPTAGRRSSETMSGVPATSIGASSDNFASSSATMTTERIRVSSISQSVARPPSRPKSGVKASPPKPMTSALMSAALPRTTGVHDYLADLADVGVE